MRIRIQLFTLMRMRIQILASKKGSNLWKNTKVGSYSIHFGLSSANWCVSRSGSGSSLSLWCGSGFSFDANADPDPQHKSFEEYCWCLDLLILTSNTILDFLLDRWGSANQYSHTEHLVRIRIRMCSWNPKYFCFQERFGNFEAKSHFTVLVLKKEGSVSVSCYDLADSDLATIRRRSQKHGYEYRKLINLRLSPTKAWYWCKTRGQQISFLCNRIRKRTHSTSSVWYIYTTSKKRGLKETIFDNSSILHLFILKIHDEGLADRQSENGGLILVPEGPA